MNILLLKLAVRHIISSGGVVMQSYITNIKLCGIKNIDKEIDLNFYKQTIPKEFTLDNSNIKAIYGENGAGKSAIIHAMDIYKKLCTKKNYLQNEQTIRVLSELINKKRKNFEIEVIFLSIASDTKLKLSHKIQVQQEKDGSFYIAYECIRNLTKRKKVCLLEVENGEINHTTSSLLNDYLIDKTKNLLKNQSVIEIWLSLLLTEADDSFNEIERFGSEIFRIFSRMFYMVFSIKVFIIDKDIHESYAENYILKEKNTTKKVEWVKKTKIDINQAVDLKKYHLINAHADVVSIEDIEPYEHKIERLTSFMKLLKSDLQDIVIEKKENGSSYICEKYFVYDGYKISIEFESAGIKKLVTLFDALEAFVNGEIVFIDELDANIHDVILLKMLAYFIQFGKGQLCFTTHNLGPMEILQKQKYAIDFLSQDSTITSWKRNGHYSATKLYRKGMIPHHPFNIEPIDFAGIFEIKEE